MSTSHDNIGQDLPSCTKIPDKWRHLKKLLEEKEWKVDRISGSHYIFVKPGHRSIPVAFHGGSVTRKYASLVLRQSGLVGEVSSEWDGTLFNTKADDRDGLSSSGRGEDVPSPREEKKVRIPSTHRLSRVTEQEKQLLVSQRRQQEERNEAETLERQKLLEKVQNGIAMGNYADAIATIDREDIDFVGSSDDNATFVSDIMFYKLVALTEEAFEEQKFNSEEQHNCILKTLKLSNQYMECFRERRVTTRELALALQSKVIQRYLKETYDAFDKYTGAYVGFDSIMDFMQAGMQRKPNKHSQEYVYGQMDSIVRCVQFMMTMYNLMDRSFGPVRELELMESFTMSSTTLTPCIRKILISFDAEDYDAAVDVSDMLLFCAEKFGDGMGPIEMAIGVFIPPGQQLTKKHLIVLTHHIKDLVPVYKYAKEELKWSRNAGVIVRAAENDNSNELDVLLKRSYNVEDTHFVSKFLGSMVDPNLYLLVSNNLTRTFMFDSLMDPVFLIRYSVHGLMYDKRGPIGVKGFQVMKEFAKKSGSGCDIMGEFMLKTAGSSASQELRKKKYDQVRRNIIHLFVQLQHVVDVYSHFHECLVREKLFGAEVEEYHYTARYKVVNEIRCDLTMLTSLTFDVSSRSMIALMLLRQVAILQSDLDTAQEFNSVESKMLKGRCKSPEEVKSLGWWSFGVVAQTMLPPFLKRYVLKNEMKRLVVIDRLGSNVLGGEDEHCRVLGLTINPEAIAFGIVSKLLGLNDAVSEVSVRKSLNQATHDIRRWAKNKSKRYVKKIEAFRKGALEHQEKLVAALDKREKCVATLMDKLEKWTLKRKKLPQDTEDSLSSANGRDQMGLVVKVGQHIHHWTQEDAREISDCVVELEQAGETATTFLHYATGQLYPRVKSIFNPSWSQNDAVNITEGGFLQNDNVLKVVSDIVCLHDILHALPQLETA